MRAQGPKMDRTSDVKRVTEHISPHTPYSPSFVHAWGRGKQPGNACAGHQGHEGLILTGIGGGSREDDCSGIVGVKKHMLSGGGLVQWTAEGSGRT